MWRFCSRQWPGSTFRPVALISVASSYSAAWLWLADRVIASANALAETKRSSDCFAMALQTTPSNAGDTIRALRDGAGGSTCSTFCMIADIVPTNRRWPVSSSWNDAPDRISDRVPIISPVNCSGDMYAGVPRTVPACVIALHSMRAVPKSAIFT